VIDAKDDGMNWRTRYEKDNISDTYCNVEGAASMSKQVKVDWHLISPFRKPKTNGYTHHKVLKQKENE
jgi:hypothetical protein